MNAKSPWTRIVTTQCVSPEGKERWRRVTTNRWVEEGLIDQIGKYFAGVAYTAVWYCGLGTLASGNPGADDSAAKITIGIPNPPVTNQWAELSDYTPGRALIAFDPATTDTIDQWAQITAPTMTFTVNVNGTLEVIFFVSVPGIGATTGVLSGVTSETAAPISIGDTINVSVLITQRPN